MGTDYNRDQPLREASDWSLVEELCSRKRQWVILLISDQGDTVSYVSHDRVGLYHRLSKILRDMRYDARDG